MQVYKNKVYAIKMYSNIRQNKIFLSTITNKDESNSI